MSYPTSRADRYQKAAEELAHLAQSASTDFMRGYYQRTAERCLLVAKGEEAPLPKWATAAVRNEATAPVSPTAPLSHEAITSVPEQAMPPLPDETIPSVPDQSIAPLPDAAAPTLGATDQPPRGEDEPAPAHGRGAGSMVRELARRVSRLASRTSN
jgi:hypothetical protein